MKVTVEELREHLEEVLEKVEQGDRVTVYSGEKAVATIDAPDELSYSHRPAPGQRFGDYRPEPVEVDFDPLEFLMEDRRKR
jgi:antitoxin (DNA-binding transcriptional repressor) of toxin-antitoxin stability system